jgi:anti-sigma B factor antagonist
MTPHDLNLRTVAGVCVVSLAQDVDLSVADRIEQGIVDRVEAASPLVVDLSQVSFLDSSGVRLMDRLVGRHSRAGATVMVVAPPDGQPRFTLRMCEFPGALLADSLADALRGFR